MQRQVERANLAPKPVQFGAELLGSHVVIRTPEPTEIAKSHLSRSLVGKFRETRVVLAHGCGNCAPAHPEIKQDLRILRGGHGFFHFTLSHALASKGARLRTIFAFAVDPAEPCTQAGEFSSFLRIIGSGSRHQQLQQLELSCQLRRSLQVVEPLGLGSQVGDGLQVILVHGGGNRFRVIGDVCFLHPLRLVVLHAQIIEALVCRFQESFQVFDRDRGGLRHVLCGGKRRNQQADRKYS